MNATVNSRPNAARAVVSVLLSAILVLFLADAAVSLLDDTLILALGVHGLGLLRELTSFMLVAGSIPVYLSTGLTPWVPKRFLLPLVLFGPLVELATIPVLIFHLDRFQSIGWLVSLCQVLLGLGVLRWVQGSFRPRWPVLQVEQLGKQAFSWLNLAGFVAVNLFVLLPGLLLYVWSCSAVAADHFSGGFLALRSEGLALRAKTYVRDDQKTVQLIPMMHIGEAEFYQQLAKSLPTNAVVLTEGVTDEKHLLAHKPRYRRVAQSLGLAEQQREFAPPQVRLRDADLDVAQFSARTISFLNLVGLVYEKGWRPEQLQKLIQDSEQPRFLEDVLDDLLTKRNANLLKQLDAELTRSTVVVVPWGAAHMRGIAQGVEKSGFHLASTQERVVVHFHTLWQRLFHGKPKRAPGKVRAQGEFVQDSA